MVIMLSKRKGFKLGQTVSYTLTTVSSEHIFLLLAKHQNLLKQ